MDILSLLRPCIRDLKPYTSARDQAPKGEYLFLDANENSFGSASDEGLNRYPDPWQRKLKNSISKLKQIASEKIFLGNGSDEAIDLLIRAFCRPGQDSVIICPPTYGIYQVLADANEVDVKRIQLLDNFTLDVEAIFEAKAKILFLCSPNNPTANSIEIESLEKILSKFKGIVIVDEAYADFAIDANGQSKTLIPLTEKYNNLVVLQTFSKSWGMAGLRLGAAYADIEIVEAINKIKLPYNVNQKTQELAIKAIEENQGFVKAAISKILSEREILAEGLNKLSFVSKIYPSETNFLLVEVDNAELRFKQLFKKGIVIRDRSKEPLCGNCLRFTVGNPEENKLLLKTLGSLEAA